MALEKRKAIGIAHELAYLLAHTPSAFVRHAQLALEFLSRNSMPCGHKQGLNAQPNFRRAKIIAEKAKRLLPGLETNGGIERVGYRPMCPDTLPILDMLPEARNVIVASGHGQLGVTLGATTGRIVADLAARRIPSVDLSPYRITRF